MPHARVPNSALPAERGHTGGHPLRRGPLAASSVLVLGAGLRLYGLNLQSAWADEITTLAITDPALTFAQFWQLVIADVHPPLYYLLLRFWSAAFGQSDLAARIPSAIFGILTIAAAFCFKPLPLVGRLALMMFIAVSPGAVEYAQEARSYSLLLFLSTIITGACVGFVGNTTNDLAALSAIVVLMVVGILASYTHYFGFLLAVAAGAIAVWKGHVRQHHAKAAKLALAGIVAGFVPWLVYHSHFMSHGAQLTGWIAKFPLAGTASWFLRLWLGGFVPAAALMLFSCVIAAMPNFRSFTRGDPALHVAALMIPLVLCPAAFVSVSTPVLTSRNLIVLLPSLYLFMAVLGGYAVKRWPILAAVCLGIELLLIARSLGSYYSVQTKEQWRESASFVLNQPGCARGPINVFGDVANYQYLIGRSRPRLKLVAITPSSGAELVEPSDADCRVILWAADLSPSDFDQLLSSLRLNRSCLRVTAFYWAFVVTRQENKAHCGREP